MSRIRYDWLPTERANPSTGKLDRLSAAQLHEQVELNFVGVLDLMPSEPRRWFAPCARRNRRLRSC